MFLNDIYNNIDNNQTTYAVFLDLKKALDTVDYSLLSRSLSDIGLAPWGWHSRGGAVLYRLSPPVGRRSPLLRTWGYVILWENVRLWTDVVSVRVPPAELNISAFPPVLRDWVTKGLGMSSLVYATGHIKDPVPLIAKRRGLSPGGRFPPSFIHQVIIITGLNKLYNCMFSP